ncbi:hypothetical protein BDW59DRAFT_41442 [Aspergillus cavernicola]|uniref:Uncharacterized protein n=1 Tax=Aspergillus cavernicola TaxID=176166 RepID=A0ABR4HAE5_9EURO
MCGGPNMDDSVGEPGPDISTDEDPSSVTDAPLSDEHSANYMYHEPPYRAYDEDEMIADQPDASEAHRPHDDADAPREQQLLEEAINDLLSTPVSTHNDPENALDSSDGELVAPDRSPSQPSTISTEPFPDYEPCEIEIPSVIYEAQADAYEYALSRIADHLNGFRGNEEGTIALNGPTFSVEDNGTYISGEVSTVTLRSIHACTELTHHDHFCTLNETRKLAIRSKINFFLSMLREGVSDHLRRRFMAMSNMVIDLEFIFFRSKNFPKVPMDYVTPNDLNRVQASGTEMVKYLSRMGGYVHQQRHTANIALYFITEIAGDTTLTTLDRFKRMAEIVIQPHRFLNRARSGEQHFLELLFEFYETFFYDDFHVMYNNYLVEHLPNIPIQVREISYLLNTVYKVLVRLIEDYERLVAINNIIGNRFIRPTVQELSTGPFVSQEYLRQHRCLPTPEPAGHQGSQNDLAQNLHADEVYSPSAHIARLLPPILPHLTRAQGHNNSNNNLPSIVSHVASSSPPNHPIEEYHPAHLPVQNAHAWEFQHRSHQIHEQLDTLEAQLRRARLVHEPEQILRFHPQVDGRPFVQPYAQRSPDVNCPNHRAHYHAQFAHHHYAHQPMEPTQPRMPPRS